MAKNRKRENGRYLNVIPTGGAIASGNPVRALTITGVCQGIASTDGSVVVDTRGVYLLAVANAASVGSIIGAKNGAGATDPLVLTAYATREAAAADGSVVFGKATQSQAGAGSITVKLTD